MYMHIYIYIHRYVYLLVVGFIFVVIDGDSAQIMAVAIDTRDLWQ